MTNGSRAAAAAATAAEGTAGGTTVAAAAAAAAAAAEGGVVRGEVMMEAAELEVAAEATPRGSCKVVDSPRYMRRRV